MAPVHVAEVIERRGRKRLRIGFAGEDGVLADAPGLDAVAEGSFVAVAGSGEALRVVTGPGGDAVVAAAGTALAAVYRIAARAGLRMGTSEAVKAAAEAAVRAPGTDDPGLVDLRALPFVTIDHERSRDLDQALYIERRGDAYAVYYALADAAHVVRPGGALFAEAVRRGASFYLPGLTIPMLPASLSEGTVSLNPAVERRALVFELVIDRGGEVDRVALHQARIRSRRKLSYAGVQAYFDDPATSPIAGSEFAPSLDLLAEVGQVRIAEADSRDVVSYDRVASQLSIAHPGAAALDIGAAERNQVEKWNEQISLVTNIEGARLLAARADPEIGVVGLFRVHPGPAPDDLAALAASIEALVAELDLEASWRWRRGAESLADYVARLPPTRLSRALQRQAMIMGQPSRFALEPAPHYGVGAAAYSRFSSPMREVVGIATHLVALAEGDGTPLASIGLDRPLLEEVVASGNRAKELQKAITRDANKLAIDQVLAADLERPAPERPRRAATAMGVSATKIYLQLDDPPVDLKLYVNDQERLLGGPLRLAGRFAIALPGGLRIRVGDELEVRVESYERRRDRWVIEVVTINRARPTVAPPP
jgi:ribonuclease R